MEERMQHQGGWAVPFIVVAVVLISGLVGSIYYVKTRNTDQVAVSNTSEKDSDKKTPEQPHPTPEKTSEKAKDAPSVETDPQPAQTAVLPETGPSDGLAKLIAVMALTIASVAYIRSR